MRCKLVPHPDAPPETIRAVEVELLIDPGDDILLRYVVTGSGLLLPEWLSPGRVDDLWQTTCFELFLRAPAAADYLEFNFSPSSQWAAYRFESYRAGRQPMPLSVDPNVYREPERDGRDEGAHFVLEAEIDLSDMPLLPMGMGISAVIEEKSGRKSWWALVHPPGPPDFHDPSCFTLELPAAPTP
jgi:hypothetical protein